MVFPASAISMQEGDLMSMGVLAQLGLKHPEQLADLMARNGVMPGMADGVDTVPPVSGMPVPAAEGGFLPDQPLVRPDAGMGTGTGSGDLGKQLGMIGKGLDMTAPTAAPVPKMANASIRAGGNLDSASTMAILKALISGAIPRPVAPVPSFGSILGG